MPLQKPDIAATEARLKAAQDRKRRRAMGQPFALDDTALEQAAQVGSGGAARAAVAWDRDSGESGLLDAEVIA